MPLKDVKVNYMTCTAFLHITRVEFTKSHLANVLRNRKYGQRLLPNCMCY